MPPSPPVSVGQTLMAGPLVSPSTHTHTPRHTQMSADTHSFRLLSDMVGLGSSLQDPIHHTHIRTPIRMRTYKHTGAFS